MVQFEIAVVRLHKYTICDTLLCCRQWHAIVHACKKGNGNLHCRRRHREIVHEGMEKMRIGESDVVQVAFAAIRLHENHGVVVTKTCALKWAL